MLLRWLVDNYLREAAQGKVREVVTDVLQGPGRQTPVPRQPTATRPTIRDSEVPEPRTLNPETSSPPDAFLPCDAAFIFALGIESGGLVDNLKGAETSRHGHGTEHAGKLRGREVVIVDAGLSGKAAARATEEAIRFYQPKWIVSAGFAGALSEQLRRGHILMADEVVSLTGQRLAVGLKLDATTAAATKGLHIGRLLTVNDIIRRPADRRRLAAEHGAIACDMETFAVAEVCHQRGVPLLAIRVISDAVDDELPPEIEHLLAQKSLAGKLGAAAGAVFRRLSAAKDLWRLREDALKASDRLAKFLVSVVEQLPATGTE
jgi:adenosylhomocysteine nucleosidase